MCNADRVAVRWLCVAVLLSLAVVGVVIRAGCGAITHPVDAGASCAAVGVSTIVIAAIVFGLATERV